MSEYGVLDSALKARGTDGFFTFLTIGKVEDNNDPDQQGRVKARCPFLGDKEDKPLKHIPWAIPVSPLGGTVGGGRAYGMWNTPQKDAQVLIACLEGDVNHRLYLGELHTQFTTNTLPHGRFVTVDGKGPFGPYDDYNEPIEPGFSNAQEAFRKDLVQEDTSSVDCKENTESTENTEESAEGGSTEESGEGDSESKARGVRANGDSGSSTTGTEKESDALGDDGSSDDVVVSKVKNSPSTPHESLEFSTRVYDTQATATTSDMTSAASYKETFKNFDVSNAIPDDLGKGEFNKVERPDGSSFEIFGQGYAVNTTDQQINYPDTTGIKYSPQTYSWTTPGFHAIAMDDRDWNSRMRLRTKSGNQIIMDDTNERIYISTAKGNTWVEIDQAGTVDIYGSRELSFAADSDINLYSKKSIRMTAEQGIHMRSNTEIRMLAKSELHIKSGLSSYMEAGSDVNLKAGASIAATAGAMVALKGVGGGYFQSGCALNLLSGGPLYATGSEAHVNSTPAAESPEALAAVDAMVPTRIPEHEPWARGYGKKANGDGLGQVDGETRARENGDTEEETEPKDNSFVSIDYDDPKVGREDRDGEKIDRGYYWRR